MESVPETNLETASQSCTTRPSVVGIRVVRRWVRRIDRRIVAAEVVAVQCIEHIDNYRRRLHRLEVDVLLQAYVEVLIAEDTSNSEECTRRRLENVGTLLSRRKTLACVRRIHSDAGAEVDDGTEEELVWQLEDSISHDRVTLITGGSKPRSVSDRRITVVESPEEILALPLLRRFRQSVGQPASPPATLRQRTLVLYRERSEPCLNAVIGYEDSVVRNTTSAPRTAANEVHVIAPAQTVIPV